MNKQEFIETELNYLISLGYGLEAHQAKANVKHVLKKLWDVSRVQAIKDAIQVVPDGGLYLKRVGKDVYYEDMRDQLIANLEALKK